VTLYASWKDAPTGSDWRWPHFTAHELACKCAKHCGGEYWHEPAFLDGLEALRAQMGPLRVNSGHRCALHNAAIGGAPLSQHKAIAADISLSGHDPVDLAVGAVAVGFKGIGFGRTFLHVDARVRPPGWKRPWRVPNAFHYPGAKAAWIKLFGFDPAVKFVTTGSL
jgi:hypothetical protein